MNSQFNPCVINVDTPFLRLLDDWFSKVEQMNEVVMRSIDNLDYYVPDEQRIYNDYHSCVAAANAVREIEVKLIEYLN